MQNQRDHGENQEQVNEPPGDVKCSPGDNPSHKENEKQDKEKEIPHHTSVFYLVALVCMRTAIGQAIRSGCFG
jgi:hypothetical protein